MSNTTFNGLHVVNIFYAGFSLGMAVIPTIQGAYWAAGLNLFAAIVNIAIFICFLPESVGPNSEAQS
ncbi:MAG: hypothetical protein EKK31_11785 [Hyphomicrobiales bacterium]|nr:MAG: hypothetical protein EKK31_11785 [Hyphomicrobiales bacterium]